MSLPYSLALAAAALLPLAAAAEQADPADPRAVVPAYRYQSVFETYRTAADAAQTPDAAWAAASQAPLEKHNHRSGAPKDDLSGKADMHSGHHGHHGEGH